MKRNPPMQSSLSARNAFTFPSAIMVLFNSSSAACFFSPLATSSWSCKSARSAKSTKALLVATSAFTQFNFSMSLLSRASSSF